MIFKGCILELFSDLDLIYDCVFFIVEIEIFEIGNVCI